MAFKVNEMSNIIIYGAGVRGYRCYKYLQEMNFNVSLVIDKEPDKVKKEYRCQVVCFDEVNWQEMQDAVVIICLQNGLLHDELAESIHKKGNNQIIFLPTVKKYNYRDDMLGCYQKLFENNWSVDAVIPSYNEMVIRHNSIQIIDDDNAMVTFWASMEYVFSSRQSDNGKADLYFNRHISCLKPYITLFNYMDGGKKFPNEYLEIFRDNNEEQQKLLRDRVKLWNVYEEKINTDFEYFIATAPVVLWDIEHNHFKIVDGHHRAVYLFLQGWYNIPLRASKKDLKKYEEYQQKLSWNSLERENRVNLFKICIELLDWIYINGIKISEIYEQEKTKGYITWWLNYNGVCADKKQLKSFGENELYISFDDVQLCDVINGRKNCWIVTSESIAQKYKIKKCRELYSGFVSDEHNVISVYEV